MNDHYYTRNPASESRPVDCEYVYRGIPLAFRTDAGVFSRGEVDAGTDLLLKSLPEEMTGDILDLGCGWGVIGICAARRWPDARVTMADVTALASGILYTPDTMAPIHLATASFGQGFSCTMISGAVLTTGAGTVSGFARRLWTMIRTMAAILA